MDGTRSAATSTDGRLQDRETGLHAAGRSVHGGLERGEFFVVFQPVVDARTTHLEGFEALVRWDRPGLGVQRPGTFLSGLAADGGLARLTDFVLASATAAAARWPDCGGRALRLRVNLCAAELADPLLAGRVWRALAVSGLSPQRLVLEVAAGDVPDLAAARRTCHRLSALGVGIALDAYGDDETALDRVRQLSCSEIKLAKTLVHDVVDHPDVVSTVGHIIELAGSLGLPVTLDGIECPEQLRLLLQTPARTFQGRHLGVPHPLLDPGDVLAADVLANRLVAVAAGSPRADSAQIHPIGMRRAHPAAGHPRRSPELDG